MPPARNAAVTREKLLTCARRRLLQESYENVSLREVAGDAGVDVALIARYFGSKEELFRAVLRKEEKDWQELTLRAADLLTYLATLVSSDDSHDAEHIERLLIMLRSAASPQAASIVRSAFTDDILEPFARMLDGPQARTRAATALSVLMGTTIIRTIMKLESAYTCEGHTFRERLTALLRVALASETPDGCAGTGERDAAMPTSEPRNW